jgi:hypothetical protein
MTANKRVKQRKCPFGKVELCDSYGNCGDCTWHKVIEKYEKRIAKLKKAEAKRYADEEVYIKRQRYELSKMLDDLENKQNEVSKQTAKEILEIVLDKISCDHIAMKRYDWLKELVSKYGIEVSK